jgi:hypothetical protein
LEKKKKKLPKKNPAIFPCDNLFLILSLAKFSDLAKRNFKMAIPYICKNKRNTTLAPRV